MTPEYTNWEQIVAKSSDLQKSWNALLHPFNPTPTTANNWYAKLTTAYQSEARHYHNLQHIQHMLTWLESTWQETEETKTIATYATWFHDAIYDSKASDNEDQSADLATQAETDLQIPTHIATQAADWIQRTKSHDPGESKECAHFLDCDLAILGAPEHMYSEYAAAIRREYAWVEEQAYRAGRAKVLRGFLERERIYITDTMSQQLEVQARRNLQKELDSLD